MKVTTQLHNPIDALLAPRTGAKDGEAASFPDTLRRAQDDDGGARGREIEGARDARGRADRDDDRREVGRRESDPREEARAEETREGAARDDDARAAEPRDAQAESETDGVEDAASGASTSATRDATSANGTAITVSSTSTAVLDAIAAVGSTAVTTTAAHVTSVAATVGTHVTTPGALPGTELPGPNALADATNTSAQPKDLVPGAAAATNAAEGTSLEANQNLTTKTSVSPSGTATTAGETAVPLSRGETQVLENATTPLATREALAASAATESGNSGWFAGEGEDAPARDRASFHLLDGEAETQPQKRAEAAPPVARPAAEPNATAPLAREGASVESVSPTTTPSAATATERTEGAAARAASEVVISDRGEPSALARKVFRQVGRSLARGDQELKIRLDPPRLGRVDVDLRADAETLKVRFVVDSEEVRDVLRTHIDDLHRSLDGTGWRAESVEIDLREGNTSGDRHDGREGSRASDGSPAESTTENSVPDRELRLWHLGKTVDLKG